MSRFFSRGKLLLTSEYVVLDGAKALAVPTNWGQEFFFNEQPDGQHQLSWIGQHQGKVWLEALIDTKTWEIIQTNNLEASQFVLKTLKNTQALGSSKFDGEKSYQVLTNLEFPANYGLGSSSTLMQNLASWAGVDPFLLNEISLGGSGYDVAVAEANHAILFQIKNNLPGYQKITFSPNFCEDLIFVHLNQKQDSREGIKLYRLKEKSQDLVQTFNELTNEVLQVSSLAKFSNVMENHEAILSQFLGKNTVKRDLFSDCPVFVKSLGAWGGDFVLTSKFEDYEKYFSNKGFNTIIPWKTMVYS